MKRTRIHKFMMHWFIIASCIFTSCQPKPEKTVDVCIYGGTSAGIIAAYTASMSGKKVLLIEPSQHTGGMTTGGLGYTDIGNKYVVTGLARDFYRRLGNHYGKLEQWIFEPSVADSVFNLYIERGKIEVWYRKQLSAVEKQGAHIKSITVEDNRPGTTERHTVKAGMFIDCTYEGDLMAKAGVSYTVGRESNDQYGEDYNGVQVMKGHQFPDGIDPYVEKGVPESGLLWGISPEAPEPNGSGDLKVQAYNYRICLTDDPANRIEITQPENYDPSRYELLIRLKEKAPWKSLSDVFIWSMMPNRKTDINNRGGFSTDMIGMNWNYPEADYDERARIIKAHEDYTKGLLYFIGHDTRIPEFIRTEMLRWGYPKDEYVDNNHWTPQLYIRESRRMVSDVVMTQHHCQGEEVVSDAIGWAAYTMDSHNCDRHVINGMVKNEGNVEIGGFPPYPISYRSIVPKRAEATNLLVPVCLSASHIAYGSIRMEPVFMVLAQSAAVAACMAIDGKACVQDVDVAQLQKELAENPLADGSQPEILIDNDHPTQVSTKGEWEEVPNSRAAYGATFLADRSNGKQPKTVRYTPQLSQDGTYDIYTYRPLLKEGNGRVQVTVFDGEQEHELTIAPEDIRVEGQTSGEWVFLGKYDLSTGKQGYIEIASTQGEHPSVADAVLLIPTR